MKPQTHFVFLGGDLEFLGAKKNQKIDNIVLGACNELLLNYNVWIRKRLQIFWTVSFKHDLWRLERLEFDSSNWRISCEKGVHYPKSNTVYLYALFVRIPLITANGSRIWWVKIVADGIDEQFITTVCRPYFPVISNNIKVNCMELGNVFGCIKTNIDFNKFLSSHFFRVSCSKCCDSTCLPWDSSPIVRAPHFWVSFTEWHILQTAVWSTGSCQVHVWISKHFTSWTPRFRFCTGRDI